MRYSWKQIKFALQFVLFVGGIVLGVPMLLFFVAALMAGGEIREKVQAFRSRPKADFEKLIQISRDFERAAKVPPGEIKYFGRPYDEPPVPDEFLKFGFERLTVEKGEVEGRLYFMVDSGGFVRVKLGDSPTIELVEGEFSDRVTPIFP